jgi:hypothetical protein
MPNALFYDSMYYVFARDKGVSRWDVDCHHVQKNKYNERHQCYFLPDSLAPFFTTLAAYTPT